MQICACVVWMCLCFGERSCFECAVPLTCTFTIKEPGKTYIAVKAQECLLVHEYQITQHHSCYACSWNSQFRNISVLHLSLIAVYQIPVVQMVWGLGTPRNCKKRKNNLKHYISPLAAPVFLHALSVFPYADYFRSLQRSGSEKWSLRWISWESHQ